MLSVDIVECNINTVVGTPSQSQYQNTNEALELLSPSFVKPDSPHNKIQTYIFFLQHSEHSHSLNSLIMATEIIKNNH